MKFIFSIAVLTCEIFFPLKDKLHMVVPQCNILYLLMAENKTHSSLTNKKNIYVRDKMLFISKIDKISWKICRLLKCLYVNFQNDTKTEGIRDVEFNRHKRNHECAFSHHKKKRITSTYRCFLAAQVVLCLLSSI